MLEPPAGISSISPTAPGPEKWQYMCVWPPFQSISNGFDILQSFYILGAVTMAWAFVIFFFLPDSPVRA
jgi:hypothetical protein